MLVEAKYEKTAETVLQQIKDRDYTGALMNYTGNILLVGINYNKDKGHTCVIEKFVNQE